MELDEAADTRCPETMHQNRFTKSTSVAAAAAVDTGTLPSSPFGLLVPGRPLRTDFVRVAGGQQKFILRIEHPASVSELVFLLMQPTTFPTTHGICLYSQICGQWKLIGVVTRERPSGIFRTGWSLDPRIALAPAVQVGVSIESLAVCANVATAVRAENDRKNYPLKIAENIFFFLSSFSRKDPSSGVEFFSVPVSALRSWLEKFKAKIHRDPAFLFKRSD